MSLRRSLMRICGADRSGGSRRPAARRAAGRNPKVEVLCFFSSHSGQGRTRHSKTMKKKGIAQKSVHPTQTTTDKLLMSSASVVVSSKCFHGSRDVSSCRLFRNRKTMRSAPHRSQPAAAYTIQPANSPANPMTAQMECSLPRLVPIRHSGHAVLLGSIARTTTIAARTTRTLAAAPILTTLPENFGSKLNGIGAW